MQAQSSAPTAWDTNLAVFAADAWRLAVSRLATTIVQNPVIFLESTGFLIHLGHGWHPSLVTHPQSSYEGMTGSLLRIFPHK